MKDFKEMKRKEKLLKKNRVKMFSKKHYYNFKKKTHIKFILEQCSYVITTDKETYRYFPKSNKLLVESSKKWIKPALSFLKKQIYVNNRQKIKK